jgi:uncharacterized OB-fold protein
MADVTPAKPSPEQTFDAASYLAAAAQHRLELSECDSCHTVFHYPRDICPSCAQWTIRPITASGRGTIYSFTVVHRAPQPAFADDVPYVLALVDTEEGARIFARIAVPNPEAVRIGLPVRAAFEPIDDQSAIVVFELDGARSR